MRKILKDRLREARARADITQSELARRIGKTRGAYNGYENSEINPKYPTLAAIAKELKVSTDYLLELTDDPTPYYDTETLEHIKKLYERPEMKTLLMAGENIGKDVVEAINELLLRFVAEKNSN